jgi:DNA-directed RNA polymerase subunit RPC12/RpoP
MTEYTWEILKCSKCGKHVALADREFKEIYTDNTANVTCPYCGLDFNIYGSKCGKMIGNRGLKPIYVISE